MDIKLSDIIKGILFIALIFVAFFLVIAGYGFISSYAQRIHIHPILIILAFLFIALVLAMKGDIIKTTYPMTIFKSIPNKKKRKKKLSSEESK